MQINSLSQQKNLTGSTNYCNRINSTKKSTESSKKNNLLQDLMKRKQSLVDYKNSLIDDSLKNNGDPKVLKAKTDEIDKQIQDIDKQITKLQMDEQQKKANQGKDTSKTKTNKSVRDSSAKSSEEVNNEKLTNQLNFVVKIGGSLDKLRTLNRQRNKLTYEKNAINADIEDDLARGKDVRAKMDLVSKLDDGIDNTNAQIAENMKQLYTDIKKNSHPASANTIPNSDDINNDTASTVDNISGTNTNAVTNNDNDSNKAQNNSSKHSKKNADHVKKHVNARA